MSGIEYSDAYKESVFQLWASLGFPSYKDLAKKVTPDENSRIPHVSMFKTWAEEGDWRARKDQIEGRAAIITEEILVEETVKMWREHASNAAMVKDIAAYHIQENGFDNSTSALNALKWAQEEERKTRGAEALVSTIRNAANEDLVTRIRKLAARQLNVDDEAIDAEETETRESGDAQSSS